MRRLFTILGTSLRMAGGELAKNKLRTFLSLFGVTIGIFCIMSVLATVTSLDTNLQNEVKTLGTNTIYIDKWEYSGGPDYPWWKYVKRPVPRFSEVEAIKERTATALYAGFKIQVNDAVEWGDDVLSGVHVYGISEEFHLIQPVEVGIGRYLTESEFGQGTPVLVIGNEVAENLFLSPERALGQEIKVRGLPFRIVGVIRKQGRQLIGGWEFDRSVVTSYRGARRIMDERHSDPVILVQGIPTVNSKVLKDDLSGTMRSIRRLSPTQEDNFSLNDVNDFSAVLSQAFVSVNIGGWAIGALSFIVGIFGVANIMFVTVKERTSQIGLKKALGATRGVILTEFLMESAFLCILGGAIGLLLVFILTQVATHLLDFPIYLSPAIIGTSALICIVAGILAGLIPASQAAKMDPVVAIRSK